MSKTFFSSDFHFNHKNIIKYSRRPFLCAQDAKLVEENPAIWNNTDWIIDPESVKKMDEELLANINNLVDQNDTLWFLGDFCFSPKGQSFETAKRYRERINCKNVYLIFGNHDDRKIANLFSNAYDLINTTIMGQKFTLCHYAMRVWDKSHRGAYMLHGHSHGSLKDDPNLLSFDCGVDCHNYKPLSFHDVQRIMSKKIYKPVDHHGA